MPDTQAVAVMQHHRDGDDRPADLYSCLGEPAKSARPKHRAARRGSRGSDPLEKLHLGGKGAGLIASVNEIRTYRIIRSQIGSETVSAGILPYPDLDRVRVEPTKSWFREGWRLTLHGHGDRVVGGLDLAADADELASEAAKHIQQLIDARDFELRRNYRLGHDFDYPFDCALCGARSGSVDAVLEKQRLVVERLGLTMQDWDRLQTGTPLSVEWLEVTRGLRHNEAVDLLAEAQRLLLVVVQRKQPVVAITFCPSCYRNAESPPPVDMLPAPPPLRVRDAVPARLRFLVLKRDAYRCTYCGKTAGPGVVLHVDHVIPVADGGPTTEDNLVTACDECNLGKSAGSVLE